MMRVLFYALLIGAFGAFMVGCGDLDYVDDYSDSTFYEEEYAEDEVEDSKKYAQEEADEEVVELASALKQEAKKPQATPAKPTVAKPTTDEEEIIEEIIEEDSPSASSEATEEFADEEIEVVEDEQPVQQEPQRVAQPTPAPQPAPKPTPAPAPAPQATAKADSQGITKIDDNTFEYRGMVFKHNLGKDADLGTILAVLEKEQSPMPKAEPKSIDSPKVARDSRPAIVPSAPSSTSNARVSKQKIRGKGFKGLTQSTAKLKAQCENNGNIQKCEDLGRIYALRGNIGSAVAYYERACDNGNGSALSCFFLSQIYANDGNSDTAQHYTSMIDESALRNKKVGSMELRLSTGKVASVKRSLKMSCTKGDEGSCNTLQSIFKMRGEMSEMKTYFGTECWRGSALGCNILRSM